MPKLCTSLSPQLVAQNHNSNVLVCGILTRQLMLATFYFIVFVSASIVSAISTDADKNSESQDFPTFVVTEILPVQHPGTGECTLRLPFVNRSDVPVIFDSYRVSCNCAKKISFPKRLIQPNEEVFLQMSYAVPTRVVDPIHMQLKMMGHREKRDQQHQVELALYRFELPVMEPIGLLTRHDKLHVISDSQTRLGIVNSSGRQFSRASCQIINLPDISADCTLTEHAIGEHKYQKIVAQINGLQNYFDKNIEDRPTELKLMVFGAVGSQLSETSVASLSVPIEWLSAIDFFPKNIRLASDIELVEVNLIGRNATIAEVAKELDVSINDQLLKKSDYSIVKVSAKWLRVQIPRGFVSKSESTSILITFPNQRWRFQIPVLGSQEE